MWAKTPRNELVLIDGIRFQKELPDIIPLLESLYRRWNCSGVWIERVGANDGVFKLASRSTIPARPLSPLSKDKLVRATEAINMAASGRIWLPERNVRPGMPLEDMESELYRFTGNDKLDDHDDMVDAVSYAARMMSAGEAANCRASATPMVLGGNMWT